MVTVEELVNVATSTPSVMICLQPLGRVRAA